MTSRNVPELLRAPASFAQQRLWFLQALEPASAVYNIAEALRLRGPLQVRALERSLNEVVGRHDALRTRFASADGVPIREIAPDAIRMLEIVDLSHLEPGLRKLEAKRLADQEAGTPFDLSRGPLLRTRLIRLGPEEHVLLLTMHHIISDGRSVRVFFEELGKVYAAFCAGRPSPLPELSIQYADYAAWQRDWLQGEILERQLGYWRRQMAGAPSVLNLPTDHPRPPILSTRGARQFFEIPDSVRCSLGRLAARESVTPFIVTLAAFATLLMRYTEQEDVVVATPIAGRRRSETEGLIGFFANTLLLRIDLSGDPAFRQLLGRVREVTLGAHENQDAPFEKLAEELRPERSLSHNPLSQVMFGFQNTPGSTVTLAGLEVERLELEKGTSGSDLDVFLTETPTSLTGTIIYSTDLFDEGTIRRLIGHFQVLLAAAIEDPERRIWELPWLTDVERFSPLAEADRSSRAGPSEGRCLHELFESQAEARPDRTALVSGNEVVSYAELNRRADRIAQDLRGRGIGPDSRVGVCLDRSADLVAALLGVLKAGAAYVPLDPEYPRDRLAFMLTDSGCRVLLTRKALAETVAKLPAEPLWLDGESVGSGKSPGNPVCGRVLPENLAYVIYTSGSTGTPKGVAIEHRSAVALMDWAHGAFGRSGLVGVLASTSICFDLSIFELFAPLSWGGKIVLARNVLELPDLPARDEVTLVNTVPSAMGELLRTRQLPPSVETVNLAGEPLPTSLVDEILSRSTVRRVFDLYGPTEDTTYSTWTERRKGEPPTIGRPLPGKRAYVLDRNLRPVPAGVPGDLYLAGAGLAREYLKRPELTAERFLKDPFEPGERMYRTGDRARRLPNGDLQFLGRSDHQVKIRGYRVEPGEIEAALRRHPLVQDAAVVAQPDPAGILRLVGYLVSSDQRKLEPGFLRAFLKDTLPDHMIPSLFRVVDSMPRTQNGKVDRGALASEDSEREAPEEGALLPQDTLELVLVKIWERVLGVPVAVGDNFFELGGHSLMAVKLFGEIEKEFGRSLPLATLFQAPTVEALAKRLRQQDWEPPWSSLVVIQGGRGRAPFFCIPGVGGNILGFYDLAKELGPDQPVYGLQARGLDGKSEPLIRVADMAAHYIDEIRAVLPEGPFLIGGASFGGFVAFEMARQLRAAGQTPALVALFDTSAPDPIGVRPAFTARVKKVASRVWFHGHNLLVGLAPREYLYSKSRTLRRRLRSRFWQLVYRSYRDGSKPLPRALRNVKEAAYLASRQNVVKAYDGRVTVFRAALRSWGDSAAPDLGWGRLAKGGVDVREVPGGHVDMLEAPQVAALAVELRASIEAALQVADGSGTEPGALSVG